MRFHSAVPLLALFSTLAVALCGCDALSTIGGSNTNYLPPNLARATPVVKPYQGCPPAGQGGDPALNMLINRTDDAPPGGYRQTDITSVITVPITPQAQNKPRSDWSANESQRIGLYEGVAVRTTGWVVAARRLGADPANCDSSANHDWALWIGTGAGDALSTTLVVILTPQMIAQRPGWTDYTLRRIVGQVVRVSGYLLYDQEPSPLVGANRATAWVIGPVMHLEAYYQNEWINLDLVPFGPRVSGTPQPDATP